MKNEQRNGLANSFINEGMNENIDQRANEYLYQDMDHISESGGWKGKGQKERVCVHLQPGHTGQKKGQFNRWYNYK